MSIVRVLPLLTVLLAFPPGVRAEGAKSYADMPVQSGGAFSVPVHSIKDLRFRNTIHQQYDFSCGSAALATLLTHHYAYPVSEQDVFREMFERGDKDKIRREGFSLLDIKSYLENHGFQADGYVADVEQLVKVGIPAIALIKDSGYYHFVVVKGLRGGRVLVGDPSSGSRAMPERQFKELWVNRVLFVIHNKIEIASFNAEQDWRAAPRAPLGDGVYRGIADALPKRGPSDY